MISEKEIMKLVKEFANSPEGKKKIKEKYGIEYNEKIDPKSLKSFGEKMKQILVEDDTMKEIHIGNNDIIVGEPVETKNGWRISISFIEESLKRESLYDDYLDGYWGDDPGRKTADGDYRRLQDIVLLYTRGYNARNYVYDRDYGVFGGHSKLSRPPNSFLKNCVATFNESTPDYIMAMINEDYINREV